MKKCKYCKSEIEMGAKICPNCRKSQNTSKLLIIVIIFFAIGIIGGIASNGTNSDVSKNSNSNNKNNIKEAKIGDTVTINDVNYIVNNFKKQKSIKAGNGYLKYDADGTYLLINISITNNSKSAINIDSNDFTLKDENDATYAASILFADIDTFNFETINPNATETGYIVYDVANPDLKYTLTIDGDEWLDLAGIKVPLE